MRCWQAAEMGVVVVVCDAEKSNDVFIKAGGGDDIVWARRRQRARTARFT
jgi:hypothetical protein